MTWLFDRLLGLALWLAYVPLLVGGLLVSPRQTLRGLLRRDA